MGAAYAKTMNEGDRLDGLAKEVHDKECTVNVLVTQSIQRLMRNFEVITVQSGSEVDAAPTFCRSGVFSEELRATFERANEIHEQVVTA